MPSTRSLLLTAGLVLAPLGLLAQKGSSSSDRIAIPGGSVTTSYVISQPGSYFLAGNRTLTVAGIPAIHVQADAVTIDLNGNTLTGTGGTSAMSYGIRADNRADLEIRNGTITQFGSSGITVNGASAAGVRLIDLRVSENGYTGIYSSAEGTLIANCTVRDNVMRGIQLSARGGLISASTISRNGSDGIRLDVAGAVLKNTVSANGACGIYAVEDALIEGNHVVGNNTTGMEGYAGILVHNRCHLRNNHVAANTSHGMMISFFGSNLDGNVVVGTKKSGGNSAGFGYRFSGMTGENFVSNNRGYGNAGGNLGPYIDAGGNFFK